MPAADLLSLYRKRGREIFPPRPGTAQIRQCFHVDYQRQLLDRILASVMQDRLLRDARCLRRILSLDGWQGNVYVFQTPYHTDYQKDGDDPMTAVAADTSAAPTHFKPLRHDGYIFADGGVWPNHPIMIGMVDDRSAFNARREDIAILNIGCAAPYLIRPWPAKIGGAVYLADAIFAAMHFHPRTPWGRPAPRARQNHSD